MKNLDCELQKDMLREKLLLYTRRAFEMLPGLDHPSILDIGCGTGVPTIELARLSSGRIVALDINQTHLDELESKIESADLSGRVETVRGSLFEIHLHDEPFDIIWSEGSIQFIGFERGLREWRRLLRPGGFLVVHDMIGNLSLKLNQIFQCGYSLLGHFTISEKIWWRDYFEPLEQRIQELRTEHRDNPDVLDSLAIEQDEVDIFMEPRRFTSLFLVMKKIYAKRKRKRRDA